MARALSTPFARRAHLIGTENAFKIGPFIKRVEDAGHRVIKCNLGEPDYPLPGHIREEVKRQLDLDQTHYCDPQGVLPLRESIAHQMNATRGLDVTPDRVCVFCGAKPPIGFAQQTYVDPGDEVIYPSPGFPIYESFIRYVGGTAVPMHLEESQGFTVDAEALASLITERTKLIILNFPSNPTGAVATQEQLASLAKVILDHAPPQARVYSDEVYENIIFDGAVHHSIASVPGMAERTIVVSGVSKSYSWTGGRVGWAVLPTRHEAQIFKNLNINYISCLPAYNQLGAKVALESEDSGPEISRMVSAFEARRDFVVKALNGIDGMTCHRPGGAFYCFPNIKGVCESLGVHAAYDALPVAARATTSPSTLFQMFLLSRYHVAAMDRRSFGVVGSEDRHFLRLSIATAPEDLARAVERIGNASQDRRGFANWMQKEAASWN